MAKSIVSGEKRPEVFVPIVNQLFLLFYMVVSWIWIHRSFFVRPSETSLL